MTRWALKTIPTTFLGLIFACFTWSAWSSTISNCAWFTVITYTTYHWLDCTFGTVTSNWAFITLILALVRVICAGCTELLCRGPFDTEGSFSTTISQDSILWAVNCCTDKLTFVLAVESSGAFSSARAYAQTCLLTVVTRVTGKAISRGPPGRENVVSANGARSRVS